MVIFLLGEYLICVSTNCTKAHKNSVKMKKYITVDFKGKDGTNGIPGNNGRDGFNATSWGGHGSHGTNGTKGNSFYIVLISKKVRTD